MNDPGGSPFSIERFGLRPQGLASSCIEVSSAMHRALVTPAVETESILPYRVFDQVFV
jgi:hypothetical protein